MNSTIIENTDKTFSLCVNDRAIVILQTFKEAKQLQFELFIPLLYSSKKLKQELTK